MAYSETLKKAVLKDYAESDLTVLQIAEKHKIKPRIIYHWTASGRVTRRQLDYKRFSFRFTRKEIDAIIKALSDYIGMTSGPSAGIAESIIDRLTEKIE